MKKRYVTISFSKKAIGKFITKAYAIQDALTAPEFSSITPTPAEVVPFIAQLQDLQSQVEQRNYKMKSARDSMRTIVETMLEKQAVEVNALANGNMDILNVCGFDISKVPSAAPLPALPLIKGISVGTTTGQVIMHLVGSRQTKYYVTEIRDADENLIREATSPRMKSDVNNLPIGIMLFARVQAVNARGASLWTVNYPFMINNIGGSQSVFTQSPLKGKAKDNDAFAA